MTSPTDPSRRWPASVGLVQIGGAAALLFVFLSRRDLWLDEAMIALNLKYLTLREITGPLEYDQVAPFGWLVLHKLLFGLTGVVEIDMRLVAIIAGMSALFAMPALAVRVGGKVGALAATAIFATSLPVVRYASEAKPYIVDVLAAVLIPAIGLHLLAQPRLRASGVAGLFIVGLVAPALSFPAAFILAGVGSTLIAHAITRRDVAGAALLGGAALIWMAAFAAVYLGLSSPQAAGTTLTTGSSNNFFAATSFAPLPPRSYDDFRWFYTWIADLSLYFFAAGRLPAMVLTVVGGVLLLYRAPWRFLILATPIAVALVASSLALYPLWHRLALFMVPLFAAFIGVAILALHEKGRYGRIAAVVAAFSVVVPQVVALAAPLRVKPAFAEHEITPLLAALATSRAPNDLIYVSQRVSPSYALYTGSGPLHGVPWMAGSTRVSEWKCLLSEIPRRAVARRVWVIDANAQVPARNSLREPGLAPVGRPVPFRSTSTARLYLVVVAPVANDGRIAALARRDGRKNAALARICTPQDDMSPPVPRRFLG